MDEPSASRTAIGAALARALHQLVDSPLVFPDPHALPIIGTHAERALRAGDDPRVDHPGLRALIVGRSRVAEDALHDAHHRGVRHYVLLGAGLDTFAYRNPFDDVRVVEVDQAASQRDKRARLAAAGIAEPASVTYLPVDFQRDALIEVLSGVGVGRGVPTVFAMLGVTPYLDVETVTATLATVAQLGPGTEIVFDYSVLPDAGDLDARARYNAFAARLAAAGEPLRSVFDPGELRTTMMRVGWSHVEDLAPGDLNSRYFADRTDDLRVTSRSHVIHARVSGRQSKHTHQTRAAQQRSTPFRPNTLQIELPNADALDVNEASVLRQPRTSLMLQTDLLDEAAAATVAQIATLRDALEQIRLRARNNRRGIEGESVVSGAVEKLLVDLGQAEWRVLYDRKWPGSRGNLDLIVVGPPGVLIIDAKNWAEPRIESGRLWHGQAPADETLAKVQAQAGAVAIALSASGLAPSAFIPMLVFARQTFPSVQLDGVHVISDRKLQAELVRLSCRLSAEQIDPVAAAVDDACPPMVKEIGRHEAASPHLAPSSVSGTPPTSPVQTTLFDEDAIWAGLIESAAAQPIEQWMTWLHPAQSALVTRSYSGPARVRGAAGTGKTVVALHRTRHLARTSDCRVLVTSFVRTLPAVQRSLFERLAPDRANRVEFIGIHSWAMSLLRRRGNLLTVDSDRVGAVFDSVWRDVGRTGPLGQMQVTVQYWRDEIELVIKGRGLNEVSDYLSLTRVGRRTPLREDQRLAVWDFFLEYEKRLGDAGLVDYADVITLAKDSLVAEPLASPYTSVVVDEVQDLTCEGLRLLHTIVGDRPDGLFIVGDGQQSIYPGGFTLSEAGVSVTGRSTVLTRNYRNKGEIIRAALEVVSADSFDDLDTMAEAGTRTCEVEQEGGVVHRVNTVDQRTQREALVTHLRWLIERGTRPGDIAVLVASGQTSLLWRDILGSAGVSTVSLKAYDGTPVDAVKVGTYARAKGLEFSAVFIPDYHRAVTQAGPTEPDDVACERNELERRCLFVAMTRARDHLWLGQVAF